MSRPAPVSDVSVWPSPCPLDAALHQPAEPPCPFYCQQCCLNAFFPPWSLVSHLPDFKHNLRIDEKTLPWHQLKVNRACPTCFVPSVPPWLDHSATYCKLSSPVKWIMTDKYLYSINSRFLLACVSLCLRRCINANDLPCLNVCCHIPGKRAANRGGSTQPWWRIQWVGGNPVLKNNLPEWEIQTHIHKKTF